MKKNILFAFSLLAAGAVLAADAGSTNQVRDAITKLQAAANFSWTTTVKIPDSPFEPGPLKGRTEKGGYTMVKQDMGDNTLEAVFKGSKIALKQDGQWLLPSEAEGFAAMMAGWLTRSGTAADEAENMLKKAKELKAGEGDVFSSDYTEEGAKALLTFGPTPPKSAKGSVKFWLKDGALNKFESHLKGMVTFGQDGEDREFEMTRTFEIQDVGATKLDVPAEAKNKLEPKPVEPKPAEKLSTKSQPQTGADKPAKN
jgi:hypothetical protein